ncbi:hypothetical protein AAMO2058_000784000 [Amorphochlora amoebiformis]
MDEEGLKAVGGAAVVLFWREGIFAGECKDFKKATEMMLAGSEYCWEMLHSGPWKEVDDIWRETYAVFILKLVEYRQHAERTSSTPLDNLKLVDKALMMVPRVSRPPLHKLARAIHASLLKGLELKEEKWGSQNQTSSFVRENEITRVHLPSLFEFECIMKADKPVVITGLVQDWPAFKKWKSLTYIRKVCGFRSVPVEVGNSYLDSKWSQKIMTVNEFIDQYILSTQKIGYLAQHELFEQIPEFSRDVLIPDYCALGDSEDGSVRLNAWFGPKGTVSPLHYDPEHNLLSQVVGKKKIRLFSHKDTPYLYPHSTQMLTNTSQVDVESPDSRKFPNFKNAKELTCTLGAGETLYIPPGYWHQIRSLSESFSVSFWFGGASAPQARGERILTQPQP